MTKIVTSMLMTLGAAAGALAFALTASHAAELPPTHIKTVGASSFMYQYKAIEVPFFEQLLPKESGGKVTADLLPYNQVGLTGPDILRLLKLGAIDFSRGDLPVVANDEPRLEGPDLAGTALTFEQIRKVADAARPMIDRIFEKNWNSKLLLLSTNPPQVFWCNKPIRRLADLKGLKVRAGAKTTTDFVEGAGGTAITMPSADVVQAVQRGVIDCAITGTSNGNAAGWPEVTTHLYPLYAGWGMQFWAVNATTWKRFDKSVQAFLTEKFKVLEDQLWEAARLGETDGINCSVGRECQMGKKYNMTLVPMSKEDEPGVQRIVSEHVLRNWAKRCGKECVEEWNASVGKLLGLTARADL